MSEQLNDLYSDTDSTLHRANEKTKNRKKSKIKINFSDVTTKGFSLKFNTSNANTKPLKLLEQLYTLGSDETLTREEKDIRIIKMLESEQ